MVFWKLKELFNVQNVGLTTWEGFTWDSVPVQQSMESPPPFVDHRAFARPYEGHWDFCCPTWTRAATGLVSCWVLSLYPGAPIEDQLPAGETCKVTTALSKDSMCWICNICSLRSMHWHATAGIILHYILGTFYIDTSYIYVQNAHVPKLQSLKYLRFLMQFSNHRNRRLRATMKCTVRVASSTGFFHLDWPSTTSKWNEGIPYHSEELIFTSSCRPPSGTPRTMTSSSFFEFLSMRLRKYKTCASIVHDTIL